MLSLALILAAALPLAQDVDPRRQFDFWIGQWSVQNRHLQPDGAWDDGTVTRARITPVCGGAAILEEWAGPLRGRFMNGFSLRAWDPARADWNLLLFWTTDGNGGFGTLRGTFRHGRGEFFTGQGASLTRYSFSDALADSVRWDSATSADGGVTWKTDWIMEFSRTRAAAEVTQDGLFAEEWTAGRLSPHPQARRLDWLLGTWSGVQTDGEGGDAQEARLRCKRLSQDCLVLDLLETRPEGARDWRGRLSVRGWASRRGAWESWSVAEDDGGLRQSLGSAEGDDALVFERRDAAGALVGRETLRRLGEDRAVIEEEERAAGGGQPELVRVTELRRAR